MKLKKKAIRRKTYTLWQRFLRTLQYRLVIPMKRSNKPPEFTARATFVGMLWAMTPLIGVQMYFCFLTWLFLRRFFKFDFSLPVSCAWTWTTNVFTMLPTYYLFFATGKIMMGQKGSSSYGYFVTTWNATFTENMTFSENMKASFDILVKDWGVALFVGCTPWMLISAVLGYYISYQYALRRYMKKQIKLAQALERRYQAAHEKERLQAEAVKSMKEKEEEFR